MRPGLQLTPKPSSPFNRPSPRTPYKRSRSETQYLALKSVVGTTATSVNGFDVHSESGSFAFIAGGAAVVATVGGELDFSQRCFRAKPTANPFNSNGIYESPTPFGPAIGPRSRASTPLRESAFGITTLGSPINEYSELSLRPTPGKDKIKTVTCLSLSPDGKLLATGETGHRPRVTVFSLAVDAPTDIPLTALSEHTFGVRCLCFSPDSQYLASLGDVNDGFLHIWSVNYRTGSAALVASNKCTNNVRQMRWLGTSLVSVGTRHVKVWRIEDRVSEMSPTSPSKRTSEAFMSISSYGKVLSGRNCLLGSLLDNTFTAVEPISSTKAVVCTEQGHICLLDISDVVPQLVKIADSGFTINAVTSDGETVTIGGRGASLIRLEVNDLNNYSTVSDVSALASHIEMPYKYPVTSVLALASLPEQLVVVDLQRSMRFFKRDSKDPTTVQLNHQLPAHGTSVAGIHCIKSTSLSDFSFLTLSIDGAVLFWDSLGVCRQTIQVPLEQFNDNTNDFTNELRTAQTCGNNPWLITGDKLGVLRVIRITDSSACYETRAHSSEITSVATLENGETTLIASAGRDRATQLFLCKSEEFSLLQTLDDHVGAVNKVVFSTDGKQLISSSADRTIIIRNAIESQKADGSAAAYVLSRTINLKATPLSMELAGSKGDLLLVSTTDRQVSRYDIATGILQSTFKAGDSEGGESVVLSSVVELPMGSAAPLVASVSSSDKSVRIYDINGQLLDRDYGHTEGMAGLVVLGGPTKMKQLVTASTDGSIFVWNVPCGPEVPAGQFGDMSLAEPLSQGSPAIASRPPVRRVLSSAELLTLQGGRSDQETDDDGHKKFQTLRRTKSKLSFMSTPRLEATPTSNGSRRAKSPSPTRSTVEGSTKTNGTRTNSPPEPKKKAQTMRVKSRSQVPGLSTHSRRRSMTMDSPARGPNELTLSTEQMCRSLHTFRKKLASSSDVLSVERVRELERELSSTARALAEKAARNETVMVKLLDQYSERLVGMLEERIETSVARHVRGKAEESVDEGVESG